MLAIKQYFESIVDYSEDDWNYFASKLEQVDISKNQLLLKPGQIENHLSFIEKGVLRFYIETDKKEVTFDFGLEGNFTSAYTSFITRKPVIYYVQALTAMSIWRVAYNDLQEIYKETRTGQHIGRLAAEQLFIRKNSREISLLTESAESRYRHLLEQNPDLIQQIPLKYLASFIGITPQALSRIRGRIY